ncbi:MAG: 3-phosphoserine/phosphohydroxythreonine transaminase [Peptococcaceae bacterium]|jgi:phosphoserine aminotransferase|nr:3-phosphoserine/phosphohydroxythreonine transaminase [Peptococcaceae bacterium]MDH7523852.1 3-phosphoserine/phosphohydroxythreonine transaminase [Peptococcaceae bacterium]
MTGNINRAKNFNAGPAALPLSVLQTAQEEMLNYQGSGMSVMEMSHRSKEYEEIHNQAIQLLTELLFLPEDYDVLFLQGGASLQFSMVPMNFLQPGKKAGYVLTGAWSEKALAEAKIFGEAYVAASSKNENYRRIPEPGELAYQPDTAYLHITSNNTIFGTQWQSFPDAGDLHLVADMSSDILSRPIDASKFSLIYAGAQKNLGPSGVVVVIIKRSLLEQANQKLPTMLSYSTYKDHNSLYNTPPCYSIYILKLVLSYVKEIGGVTEIYRRNKEKAALIYDAIDQSGGFYRGHAEPGSRSLMNITFRLPDEELEKKFLVDAKKEGFVGLNGHRSVGGCRASAYNAVSYQDCAALKEFMEYFKRTNG